MPTDVILEDTKTVVEIFSPIVDVSVRPLSQSVESTTVVEPSTTAKANKPTYPLDAKVYRIKPPVLDYAIYITLTCHEINGELVPYQIFINSKHNESVQSLTATTRLITRALSLGASISDIKNDLNVTSESPYWYEQRNYPSVISHIAQILEDYSNLLKSFTTIESVNKVEILTNFVKCPKCGERSAIMQEGCLSCTACDYSRCS